MATLGKAPGGLGAANPDLASFAPGSFWRMGHAVDAYSRPRGAGLATQVDAGRHLQVLDLQTELSIAERNHGLSQRLRARLLEDGYPCWLEMADLQAHAQPALRPALPRLDRASIAGRLGGVIRFAERGLGQPNRYLWGGTLGPDFDCSGLIQTAFAAMGIWLPRDAYLQERFCQPVALRPGETSLLEPGDLIFFGTIRRCTHVGLHLGEGRYLHSSGRDHGRDGLGIDDLHPHNPHPVARHYRKELRGAGRVMHSHDGSPLPP